MDAVAKARQPLRHGKEPNSKFTLKRKEFKKAEDVKLITDFAQWLSDLTEMDIKPDSFPEDLLSGIALCKVMMRIDGSGVSRYHAVKNVTDPKEAFRARENVAQFQAACKRLDLPSSFGTEELEVGDLGSIASTLVYVAHAAVMRNVGVKELDDVLRKRLGLVVKEEEEIRAAHLAEDSAESAAAPSDVKAEAKASDTENAQKQAIDSAAAAPGDAVDLSCVGMSLKYLRGLFSDEQIGEKTVEEVASELVAPLVAEKMGGNTCPLSHLAHKEQGNTDHVAIKADIVVCYDPEMKWKDLVLALESSNIASNMLSHTGTSTLWIDLLCMQSNPQVSEREQLIKTVIERIGRVELVLHPWDRPSIALKSFPVWEVCCAVTCRAPIFACFLPKDQDAFLESVYSGLVGSKTFQKVFYDLNVERAVSSDPEQIIRILRVLRNDVGTTRVNDAFIIPIKNWILESLRTGGDREGLQPAKRSNLFMTRGAFHQCIGQPDEAKRYFDKVLDVQQEVFPDQENPSTATALSNMASTLRELGEFKEAEQVCERALRIRVTCLGEGHPAVLVSRAWLGDILLASGEFQRALPILQKVLEDQQKIKASDIDVASAMNNLASALRETGRMEEARKHFEEVLTKVEKVAGVDHPLYGAALNNCALTLESQHDYKNALKMHEKSLSLRIRALGPEHPDVALSMHNLGVCLLRDDKVKNLDKATDLGKKALAIWEKTLGPKHPTVIDAKRDWKDLIRS